MRQGLALSLLLLWQLSQPAFSNPPYAGKMIDLHTHIEAAGSWQFFEHLAAGKAERYDPSCFACRQPGFVYPSVEEFLNAYFEVTHPLKTADDYYALTRNIIQRFKEQGVIYAELIVCPSCAGPDLHFQDMLLAISRAIEEEREPGRFEYSMVMTFIRGYEEDRAQEFLDFAIKMRNDGHALVGIHLSGDEAKAPSIEAFIDVYRQAGEAGLGLAAHAGEWGPRHQARQNIRDAILKLNVQRIGHGVAARGDQDLEQLIREHNVALEVCPSSTIKTKAQGVQTYDDHPAAEFFREGLVIVPSADDPILFDCDTPKEWRVVDTMLGGPDGDRRRKMLLEAVRASFASEGTKHALIEHYQLQP